MKALATIPLKKTLKSTRLLISLPTWYINKSVCYNKSKNNNNNNNRSSMV